MQVERNYYESFHYSIHSLSDSVGFVELFENIEVERTERDCPDPCTADIPYSSGVGKI